MSSVLKISPLTRVEGHGTVHVHFADGRFDRVELAFVEAPRLFEALLVGKRFDELPEIICRICSICSSVHRVTSLYAIEQAFGVEVNQQTELHRELIVNGGQIESHALHLFCLVLPDYYGLRGFADLATVAPGLLQAGLRLKAAGNLIQEMVGGRLIHPANLLIGGLGKPLTTAGLHRLRSALQEVLPVAADAIEQFASPLLAEVSLPFPSFMAVANRPSHSGGEIVCGNGSSFPIVDYRNRLTETIVPHSHAKQCTVSGESPTVGALARLNLGARLGPVAIASLNRHGQKLVGDGITANSLAQAVELLAAVERALEIVELLLAAPPTDCMQVAVTPCQGTGTAAMEAPRGTLIHHFAFDSRGICTATDIITPTAINQGAMERDLGLMARSLEGVDRQELARQLEMLVRAYDPCISCAVH